MCVCVWVRDRIICILLLPLIAGVLLWASNGSTYLVKREESNESLWLLKPSSVSSRTSIKRRQTLCFCATVFLESNQTFTSALLLFIYRNSHNRKPHPLHVLRWLRKFPPLTCLRTIIQIQPTYSFWSELEFKVQSHRDFYFPTQEPPSMIDPCYTGVALLDQEPLCPHITQHWGFPRMFNVCRWCSSCTLALHWGWKGLQTGNVLDQMLDWWAWVWGVHKLVCFNCIL